MVSETIKSLKNDLKDLKKIYTIKNKKDLIELKKLNELKYKDINNIKKKLNFKYKNINKKNKKDELVDLYNTIKDNYKKKIYEEGKKKLQDIIKPPVPPKPIKEKPIIPPKTVKAVSIEESLKSNILGNTLYYNENIEPNNIVTEFYNSILFKKIHVENDKKIFIKRVLPRLIQKDGYYILMKFTYEIIDDADIIESENYITLNTKTINDIIKLYSISTSNITVHEDVVGMHYSDMAMVYTTVIDRLLSMDIRYKKNSNKSKLNGKFFKYMTINEMKKINLSKYGIYNENYNFDKINNNCFIHCLENYIYDDGTKIDKVLIDKLKLCIKNLGVPRSEIKNIANKYNISFNIFMRDGRNKFYGNKDNKIIKLGLSDNHYFIYDNQTGITKYALEHIEEIKHIKNWNKIYKKDNKGKYKKTNNKQINSLKLVNLLINNYNNILIKEIPREKLINTIYINESKKIDNLDYNINTDTKLNDYNPKQKDINYVCGFDFETRTDLNIHTPYLVCYKIYKLEDVENNGNIEKINTLIYENYKVGESCGKLFLDDIYNFLRERRIFNCALIAHNISYDIKFIFKYMFDINLVHRSTNSICCGSGNFRPFGKGGKDILKFLFIDSCALLPYKLSSFKDIFKLEVKKEILPYEIYNSPLSYNINSIYKIDDCFKNNILKENDRDEFIQNINSWGLFNEDVNYFYHVAYSLKYCEMDVIVMMNGYFKFRDWIWRDFKLDVINNSTISNLAFEILEKSNCLKDCYSLSSIPREFIAKTIVGGRTMTRNNKKCINRTKYNDRICLGDFDACSLYPSAIKRLSGFLKGIPKILKNDEKNLDFLKSCDGYFVECKILNYRKEYNFPLLNSVNEKGIRMFKNKFEKDKIFNLNKIDIEDLLTFGVVKKNDIVILRGYYFNDGRNILSKELIEKLYNTRKERKREKNPIQEAYKLIMNSIYGKTGLKENPYKTLYFDNKKEMLKYYSNHYDSIKSCESIFQTYKYKIKDAKPINEHFNYCHIASEILSMSKRIMNEVMTLADDLKIKIYYQDTDSMHIDISKIDLLCDEYFKKYNRELRGDNMGQFHVDFDELKKDNKVYEPIEAVDSIFLGKKMYVDYIKYVNKEDKNDIVYDYHYRLKGIPQQVLKKHAIENYDGNIFNLYLDLYNGKEIKFDLLSIGIKFDNRKAMVCKNITSFYRNIKI